jgi:hypothetical protein
LGQPWDEALTVIDVVTVLGPVDSDVQRAAERSREILVRVGAAPFANRLDALTSQATPAQRELTGRPPTLASMAAQTGETATTGG